ncbi:MAG TPA: hypothetical protein PKD54_14170, partial [Pirellulaceae bacterium]|nr:hypothetical protein [Pirellulaceae bacterium]
HSTSGLADRPAVFRFEMNCDVSVALYNGLTMSTPRSDYNCTQQIFLPPDEKTSRKGDGGRLR